MFHVLLDDGQGESVSGEEPLSAPLIYSKHINSLMETPALSCPYLQNPPAQLAFPFLCA